MSKLPLTCLDRQLQVSLPSPWCCLAPFPATLFGSGRILLLTQGLHQPWYEELKFFTISSQLKMFHLESLGADVCTSWDKEIKQSVNDYVLHWDVQCPEAKLDKF